MASLHVLAVGFAAVLSCLVWMLAFRRAELARLEEVPGLLAVALVGAKLAVLVLVLAGTAQVHARIASGRIAARRASAVWLLAVAAAGAPLVAARDDAAVLLDTDTTHLVSRHFVGYDHELADGSDRAHHEDWLAAWRSGRVLARDALFVLAIVAVNVLVARRAAPSSRASRAALVAIPSLAVCVAFAAMSVRWTYDVFHEGVLAGPLAFDLLMPYAVHLPHTAVASLFYLAVALANAGLVLSSRGVARGRRPAARAAAAALLVVLVPAVPSAAAASARGQDEAEEPPDRRETGKLVEEYLLLDARDADGLRRQGEILARLDLLPPLDAREAARWRKQILQLWQKRGPEIESRSGRHYLWEDEEKGLYLVGGRTRRPKGLFVGLHGGGVGAGDATTARSAFESAVSKRGWVAIYPQVLDKLERGWTDGGTEEFLVELIERAIRTFRVDRDRVYMGGHSMGGFGAWTVGAHHADLFAALAPSAGAPTPYLSGGRVTGIVEGVVPSLRNVHLAIYQSDDDPRVAPGANRKAVEMLREHAERYGGYSHDYWELEGRGHDLPPGGMDALLARIEEHARDPRPPVVVWEPVIRWKRQFYWLWWSKPVPRSLVVAELDREANEVRLEVSGGSAGLRVQLDDELLDLDREVVVRLGDEVAWSGVPERTLSAVLATAARGDPALCFDAWVPVFAVE